VSPAADAGLDLVVNGDRLVVAPGSTVEDLLALLGVGRRGVAVAVDGVVVPRSSWPATALGAGQAIEVVTAAAGG
jgi:sulfur carrier protein